MIIVMPAVILARKAPGGGGGRLYTEGTEDVAWVAGYSSGDGSQSKEADHLRLYAAGQGGGLYPERTWVTDGLVDLTGWNTLWIDWLNNGMAHTQNLSAFIISTNKSSGLATYTRRVYKTSSFARVNESIDVSDLNAGYYVRIHAKDNNATFTRPSGINTYNVWLQ